MQKDSIIAKKTFIFSLDVIKLYKKLIIENEYIISKQLLRSATSIWANVEEALAGQSKKDFISKMSIASKEARETRYWLHLLDESDLTEIDINSYLDSIEQIINIIVKIVKTSQQNNL